jgi:hypothetical protein
MKEKLQHFPITMYAVVMGMAGLTIVLGKFYHLHWLPKFFIYRPAFYHNSNLSANKSFIWNESH